MTATPIARPDRNGGAEDGARGLWKSAAVSGWLLVGATTVAFGFGASLPVSYQLVPLVASVLVLGLPHGAVDHLAVPRTRGEAITVRWLVAIGLLYLLVGGAYAIVWFFAPVAAAVSFLFVTWFHWGLGDVYSLVALTDGYPADRVSRALMAATRGSLPMAVPFVAFPEQYELVVVTLVELFDADSVDVISLAFSPSMRLSVAIGLAFLISVTLAVGVRSADTADRRWWLLAAAETCLLAAFFSVVPPLFAVGLYFCVWHSIRHVVRLLAVDPGAASALRDRRYTAAFASFARDAAPLTAISIGVLALWYRLVPGAIDDPLTLVGGYLALIAVFTLPHVVVVGAMDREQGLWTE